MNERTRKTCVLCMSSSQGACATCARFSFLCRTRKETLFPDIFESGKLRFNPTKLHSVKKHIQNSPHYVTPSVYLSPQCKILEKSHMYCFEIHELWVQFSSRFHSLSKKIKTRIKVKIIVGTKKCPHSSTCPHNVSKIHISVPLIRFV